MTLTAFEYSRPSSLREALAELAEHPGARPLAGGMSLLPLVKMELAAPSRLVDLSRVEELSGIEDVGNSLRIGAMTRHYMVARHPLVAEHVPLLARTASHIGDPQVRHRGTIGGSLAHADPAADFPAAVLATDAVIEASSLTGTRDIPAPEFFLGPLATVLTVDEVIVAVRVPKQGSRRQHYAKVPHPASGYAVVGVAVSLDCTGEMVRGARIAVTGVAGAAFRALRAETAMAGSPLSEDGVREAAGLVTDGQEVLGDVYASSEYRRHLAAVTTGRALLHLIHSRA